MEQSLSELISLSRAFGSDIRVAWKGGGNISVKSGDGTMFIKASGTEIGGITRFRGWRKVDIEGVRQFLKKLLGRNIKPAGIKTGLINTCCDGLPDSGMPSIETFFHSLLGRYVIHLHPMELLPYLCSKTGQKRLRRILPASLGFHWIAFRGLGVVTAGQIRNCIARKKLHLTKTHVFFLSNHGVIVSASSLVRASNIFFKIVDTCRNDLPPRKRVKMLAAPKTLSQTAATVLSCLKPICPEAKGRRIISVGPHYSPDGVVPNSKWFAGVITPEELTYLGAGIVWVKKTDTKTVRTAIRAQFHRTGLCPKAFYIPQQGLFVCDDKKNLPLYRKVFIHYLFIRACAARLGGLRPLVRKYLSGEGL